MVSNGSEFPVSNNKSNHAHLSIIIFLYSGLFEKSHDSTLNIELECPTKFLVGPTKVDWFVLNSRKFMDEFVKNYFQLFPGHNFPFRIVKDT